MRKTYLVAGLLLAFLVPLFIPSVVRGQEQESVAEAARKAREKKKTQAKAKRVITDDMIPTSGGAASTVGGEKAAATGGETAGAEGAAKEKAGAEKKEEKGEEYWRGQFAEARSKLAAAEKELELLRVELNKSEKQYYSDPNEALREQYERKEINDKRKAIEDKQKEIQQLRQALTDLEDSLRRAGGNAAWAR